jgi:hypothetical protein
MNRKSTEAAPNARQGERSDGRASARSTSPEGGPCRGSDQGPRGLPRSHRVPHADVFKVLATDAMVLASTGHTRQGTGVDQPAPLSTESLKGPWRTSSTSRRYG